MSLRGYPHPLTHCAPRAYPLCIAHHVQCDIARPCERPDIRRRGISDAFFISRTTATVLQQLLRIRARETPTHRSGITGTLQQRLSEQTRPTPVDGQSCIPPIVDDLSDPAQTSPLRSSKSTSPRQALAGHLRSSLKPVADHEECMPP